MKHTEKTVTTFETPEGQWPSQWLFQIEAAEAGGAVKTFTGSQVRMEKNSTLTYWCACGATINRAQGEKNEEMAEWVKFHSQPLVHAVPEAKPDVPN